MRKYRRFLPKMQNYKDNGASFAPYSPDSQHRSENPNSGRLSLDLADLYTSDGEEIPKPYQDSHSPSLESFDSPFKPSSTLRFLLKSTAVILVLILVLGVVFSFSTMARYNSTLNSISFPRMSSSLNPSQRPCGGDPKSARDALCYFDPVTVAWLPSECHDYELTAEFWKEKERHFYARPGALLSLANVMQGQHTTVFVNGEYLRDRCLFAWRKAHRAVLAGTKIDGYSLDWGSLLQCEDYLLRRDESFVTGLHAVNVSYPSCSSI